MVLSRRDVLKRIKKGDLSFDPLELNNYGALPIELRAGVDDPCQLILLAISRPLTANEAYGSDLADLFAGQTEPIPGTRKSK